MSPKAAELRADAKASPSDLPCKHTGSDSVCTIYLLNRTQTQLARDIAAAGRDSIEARFWPKVNKTNTCWLWTASKMDRQGHGQFTYTANGIHKRVYAHRLSYELLVESIPDGMVVCHVCDVPACVRPQHLFLGTQRDNLRDASRKGRLTVSRTRKLSLQDRLDIQASTESGVALAARYGVTKACISLTKRGRFVGARRSVLERVPYVHLPIRGEVA